MAGRHCRWSTRHPGSSGSGSRIVERPAIAPGVSACRQTIDVVVRNGGMVPERQSLAASQQIDLDEIELCAAMSTHSVCRGTPRDQLPPPCSAGLKNSITRDASRCRFVRSMTLQIHFSPSREAAGHDDLRRAPSVVAVATLLPVVHDFDSSVGKYIGLLRVTATSARRLRPAHDRYTSCPQRRSLRAGSASERPRPQSPSNAARHGDAGTTASGSVQETGPSPRNATLHLPTSVRVVSCPVQYTPTVVVAANSSERPDAADAVPGVLVATASRVRLRRVPGSRGRRTPSSASSASRGPSAP